MRLFWYIAFAFALWYLGKAVMRHYISGKSSMDGIKGSTPPRNSENSSPDQIRYEDVQDTAYRDVE